MKWICSELAYLSKAYLEVDALVYPEIDEGVTLRGSLVVDCTFYQSVIKTKAVKIGYGSFSLFKSLFLCIF